MKKENKMGNGFWKQKNVFVTGATGLLGSWLVEELLHKQANVVTLIRDWVPASKLVQSEILTRTSVVRGDLEDYTVLLRALNEYQIDTVFHLGAQTIVGTASRSALSTFESNVRGTWNLMEACKACSGMLARVLIASSDKAYGPNHPLPYTEDMCLKGQSPYDVSKSCADLIALSYFHTYALPVAVTRCGNLFGGGDLNFDRLVPGTIRSALQEEPPVIRSDGRYLRDYFFVRDAVDAYFLLAERLRDLDLIGQAFNFGNETPISVLDLVQKILQITQKDHLQPVILNQAKGEIPQQYLDCTKARTSLGWKPGHSIEQGLQETIDWYSRWLKT